MQNREERWSWKIKKWLLRVREVDNRPEGALTLVLGTHCKTDSRSCGCRLEKRGLSQTKEFSEGGGGAVRGAFPVGAVVVSLASPRKASWISYN